MRSQRGVPFSRLRTRLLVLSLILISTSPFTNFTVSGQQSNLQLQLINKFNGAVTSGDLGLSITRVGDLFHDGYNEILIGAPGESPGNRTGAGSAYLFSGKNFTLIHRFDGQNSGDDFGASVSGTADLNGDGYADLLIGADMASPGGRSRAGSVYVFEGRDFSLIRRLDGVVAGELFGASIATVGDLHVDARPEFAVGAIDASPDSQRTNAGSVYVYFGSNLTVYRRLDGEMAHSEFGVSLAGVADVNGDGIPDLLVGADLADPGGRVNAGSAYLFSGRGLSLLKRFDGEVAGDFFGTSVAGGLGIPGDGRPDLIIGAPSASPGGRANVGSAYLFSGSNYTLIHRFDGPSSGDDFGWAVSMETDPNNVSPTLIIAADLASPGGRTDAGSVYIYSGIDFGLIVEIDGESAGDNMGWSVYGGTSSDYLFGAPFNSHGGLLESGAAYLYKGSGFVLSASPASLVLYSGSSLKSTVRLYSLGNFSGTVSLSASTSPQGLSISLNQTSVDLTMQSRVFVSLGVNATGAQSGNYDVTITGNSGSEAETTRVQVRVLAPGATNQLTLTATSNITGGTAPLTVSFSSQASGGISPYSYSWSFDDGQSSAVSSPVHTYSLPRFYSANVTVTDAGGRSVSQTVGITVLAQPPIQNGSLLSTYLSYGLAGSLVALGLMVVLYLRRDAQLKHGSSGDATRATSGNP
ncbi:PKD domain-containing protein [Candidatus Bathyarchaeota archaeon]|nr:MAG: PKD domain-containing protein [Candidatus Bathyarchaeota archaeon]